MFQERNASNCNFAIKGKSKILGERTLARAIESRNPNANLVFAAGFHRKLHLVKKPAKLFLDTISDDIFRDFCFQAAFLGSAIGDDLFNCPVDVSARIKKISDVHSHYPAYLKLLINRLRVQSASCHPLGISEETSNGSCQCARLDKERWLGHEIFLAIDSH